MKTTVKRRKRRVFSSEEKGKAVLSLWSERRSVAEVCQEMSLSNAQLSKWQHLAMEGILSALESKHDQVKQPALNRRVEALMEKKITLLHGTKNRLEERLVSIQKERSNQKE
jgi:transposase-like protein